jgi:threonine dehydrogenase-like Zn-dependent dehydrogenase
VGTVKAVGPEVTDAKAGDRVVCELVTFYCGRCINCQTGRINICCNMPSMQQRAHYVTGGGYARYTVWPARHVHVLPPSISLEEGTLIEPTAGSVHSMIERMKVRAGESVIILGPGARGLILLQIAKACGASPVVITGLTGMRPPAWPWPRSSAPTRSSTWRRWISRSGSGISPAASASTW